jgi:lysophospholipase L1-like esterase
MGLRPPALILALLAAVGISAARADQQEYPGYLALGDSLAFGVGAANPAAEGYVGLTHFALSEEGGAYEGELDLINVAEPGATSEDLLEPEGQLERALAEIDARESDNIPDNDIALISIDVGGNDLLQLADPDSPCVADTGSPGCREAINGMLAGLRSNLAEILLALREAAPNARIFAVNLYNPYSGTGDVRELLANVAVQQVNGVINATASDPAYDVELVPVFELFMGRGDQWIASDGIHPNNDGHRVMSEALLASIGERPPEIPDDLASVPTGPATGEAPVPGESQDDDGGVPFLVLAIITAIAFTAGIAVSGLYVWARGRG